MFIILRAVQLLSQVKSYPKLKLNKENYIYTHIITFTYPNAEQPSSLSLVPTFALKNNFNFMSVGSLGAPPSPPSLTADK